MLQWVSGLFERTPCAHLPQSAPQPASDGCQEYGQRFSMRVC
jgi:hypothetical protein